MCVTGNLSLYTCILGGRRGGGGGGRVDNDCSSELWVMLGVYIILLFYLHSDGETIQELLRTLH